MASMRRMNTTKASRLIGFSLSIRNPAAMSTSCTRWILPSHYYSIPRRSIQTLATASNLYCQPELSSDDAARAFPRWSRTVWERSERRLQEAIQGGQNVAATIDAVSEDLCSVLDSASCCTSTHGDAETRRTAERTFLELYEKVQTINLNTHLYEALKQDANARQLATKDPKDDDDDEIGRVTSKLIEEFEWEGAGIESTQQRQRVGDLQNHIRALGSKLESDAMMVDSNRRPFNLGNGIVVPNTEQTFQQLLAHPELDETMKRHVYMQRFKLDEPLAAMAAARSDLRLLRHELACSLGFKSFAHLQVHKNMALHPEQVETLLIRVADQIRPIANGAISSNQVIDSNTKRRGPLLLNEWELPSHPRFSSKRQRISKRIDGLFTIERCLLGLERVAKEIFNVNVKLLPSMTCTWKASTKCFEMHLTGDDDALEAVLYLDLFARDSKSPGAALYQIRTRRKNGRTISPLPSVAFLSCSFPYSNPSNPLGIVVGHAGFRTLMHEFGHALHALLSETRYQHLSGTRCEMDFMETPSLLLERMSWDPRVVRLVDEKHQVLDEGDLKAIEETRLAGFSALDLQEQVLCALFDLHVCGDQHDRSENELYWDVRKRLGSFAVPNNYKDVHKELYFFHSLGTYAGSFYTYPWSSAIVASVYKNLFENESAMKDGAGVVFRDELLRRGGSRDPFDVLERLTGSREVNEEALLKDLQQRR